MPQSPRKMPPGNTVTICQPLSRYNNNVNPTKPNKGFPNEEGDRRFLRLSAKACSLTV